MVTLDGFEDVLKRFLAEKSTQQLIHPESNYKRWLLNGTDEYTYAGVYNNFGSQQVQGLRRTLTCI